MSDDSPRAAIVTTLRLPDDAGTVVRSFIEYHLRIGFAHLYLCFDDASDRSIGARSRAIGSTAC